jgi:hypothetical protein
VWIGAKGAGVFILRGGQQLEQLHDPVFDNLLQDPHCMLVDHEGRLWVGSGEDSVLYREGRPVAALTVFPAIWPVTTSARWRRIPTAQFGQAP